ncbi:uncharacterized protein LOC124419329 isoform X2 [Lucilia cuprina]|uniref:uncharacterized protein LOC124419329 isoform X2 n=1 Tax=Lucilia cuprina TaxID=7375 RepID=UPI001F05CFD8|nr:uncharacterized protein LOC124419329 isoform X2 [Lucilia cuprina]
MLTENPCLLCLWLYTVLYYFRIPYVFSGAEYKLSQKYNPNRPSNIRCGANDNLEIIRQQIKQNLQKAFKKSAKRMAIKKWVLLIALLIGITTIIEAKFGDKLSIKEKDLMQKAIVFDKKTPDLFYCPTQKPSAMNKLIVRSRPLHKLCEYEGRQLPEDYKSDCYEDIDESNYACKEKYRIMKRVSQDDNILPNTK